MKSTEERFWAKVDVTDDCWLWTGATRKGYGRFLVEGRNALAHRYAYELLVGPIPDGKELDHQHTCPKRCVRPHHLRPVTKKQNLENRSGPYSNSRTGVRGVTWRERTKQWEATVTHHGKKQWVGSFISLEDAEAAVIARRNQLFTHNDIDRKVS